MTTLAEIRDWAAAGAKALKEAACRSRPRDIRAVIDVYRGNDLIAQVVPVRHDRDVILNVFRACARGLDADALALTFESFTTSVIPTGVTAEQLRTDPALAIKLAAQAVNPVTGRAWAAGEMADVAMNHRGLERGWVWEAVTVLCANRAGDVGMTSLPYRYSGKHLVWLQESTMPAEATPDGVMTDAMIAAMNEASLATLAPHAPGEEGRALRDIMATEMIKATHSCAAALYAHRSQHDRVRTLRSHGVPFA